MPRGGVRPQATCHPEKPHYGRGLCRKCFDHEANLQRNYAKENRVPHGRAFGLKRRYNITLEDYEQMLTVQGGVCAICGRTPDPNGPTIDRFLHVDHNHETEELRGLLCGPCNKAVGALGDTLEGVMRAVTYLQKSVEWKSTPNTGARP
jgi:Recombination endonuclease VII